MDVDKIDAKTVTSKLKMSSAFISSTDNIVIVTEKKLSLE